MGSVRVRPETNTLYFDFRYRGIRCREFSVLPATKANEQRMQRALRVIESEIRAGTFSYRKHFPNSKRVPVFEGPDDTVAPLTREEVLTRAEASLANGSAIGLSPPSIGRETPMFPAFARQWYADGEVAWKRSNREKVQDILDGHLIPRFQGRRVGEIAKADILAFRTYLAKECRGGKGISNARINGVLNVLRQILEEAAQRFMLTSPYRNIKPLRVGKTVVDPFTLEEVGAILEALPAAHRPLYTVAFFTGLRTSELLGLQWDGVNLERGQVQVKTTWVCGELDTPKTNGSERTVELSTPVVAALREQAALTKDSKSAFVFCAANGQPLSRHNLANRVWKPTLKALGLRHRRPYQTRHTAATLWLAAGEAPEWIAKQMGHTSTKMLFTVYSNFVPNLTRKDGSMFELLVGSRFGGQRGEGEGDGR